MPEYLKTSLPSKSTGPTHLEYVPVLGWFNEYCLEEHFYEADSITLESL